MVYKSEKKKKKMKTFLVDKHFKRHSNIPKHEQRLDPQSFNKRNWFGINGAYVESLCLLHFILFDMR